MSTAPLSLKIDGAPAGNGADLVKETTTAAFTKDVLEASRNQPVLVDFWAPWCGPCRTLGPIIEKAVAAAKGAVRLVKMNIDDHPEVAGQLGIQSIPAVIAFSNGQPVDGFIGALPESQVKAFIDRVAGPIGPSPVETLVADANALLEAGSTAAAADLFTEVLATDPGTVPAIVGLARCLLAEGELDRARQVIATAPAEAGNDAGLAAVRAQIELAEESAKLGDAATLEARIASDPADLQARFDLAVLLNGKGDRDGATDRLLEIMRKNRSWEDEKARKQLLQFFEAWGPMDEATLAGRRKLSSLLFA
jgi:putative thioredoxin